MTKDDDANVRQPDQPDRPGPTTEQTKTVTDTTSLATGDCHAGEGDNRAGGRNYPSTFNQGWNADEPRR